MRVAPGDMQAFLDKCNLPTLNQTDRDYLGEEITCREIADTIKSLKSGKTPGPDGFSNKFYKKFSYLLVPYLNQMYGQAFDSGELPRTLNEATITLISKKGRDPEEMGSPDEIKKFLQRLSPKDLAL